MEHGKRLKRQGNREIRRKTERQNDKHRKRRAKKDSGR